MGSQLTPSAKSAFIAGAVLSLVGWISLFHLDHLAKLFKVNRIVKQEPIFVWMNNNKALTLLFSEFLNFGVHGISNSDSVTFAIGSTFWNAAMIFIMLPIRMGIRNKRYKSKIHVVNKPGGFVHAA